MFDRSFPHGCPLDKKLKSFISDESATNVESVEQYINVTNVLYFEGMYMMLCQEETPGFYHVTVESLCVRALHGRTQ